MDPTLSSPEETAAFTRRLAALFERHTLILKAKAVETKDGRTPLWRALLQTAVALDPKDPQPSVDDSGDEAAGAPTLAKAYTNLGAAYEQKGLLDDARAALQRALTIAPGLSEAHYDLANVSYKSGRVDDAIASYEAALRFNPNLVLAHYNLGVMYYQRQDFEHAIDHIDRAAAAGFSVPPRLLEALKPHRK